MGCCAQDEEQSPAARWLPKVFGGLLVVAGALVLVTEWGYFGKAGKLRWEKTEIIEPGRPEFADHAPKGDAQRLLRYKITQGEVAEVTLTVAEYRSGEGLARAIVYPPGQGARSDASLRHDLWQEAANTIRAHAPAEGQFLAWWDDAQRIAFGTGKPVWAALPPAAAFSDRSELGVWKEIAGGMADDDTKLRQWARWLTMDADQAIAEMQTALRDRPSYLLVCLDDLARLGEIEAMSGRKLPFEFRLFAPAKDLHGQIAAVKAWAADKGTGNYLVQQLSSGEARAWRITTEEGARTLLARLLPFTSSLAKPLETLGLVYQSAWGAYLAVYRLKPAH